MHNLAETHSEIVQGLTIMEGYILVLSPDTLSRA
jgi:hypothetical protein